MSRAYDGCDHRPDAERSCATCARLIRIPAEEAGAECDTGLCKLSRRRVFLIDWCFMWLRRR